MLCITPSCNGADGKEDTRWPPTRKSSKRLCELRDGDTVVALGSYTWKHKSSGEPAAVKMVHVWTMNGGKAVAFQQHVDTLKVRELS